MCRVRPARQRSSDRPEFLLPRRNLSLRSSARRAASPGSLALAGPVNSCRDDDAHHAADVGPMQRADEVAVEELVCGDKVAEQAVVVDKQKTGRGAAEPRDQGKARLGPSLKEKQAQQHDGRPGGSPEIGEDEEVFVS